MCSSDLEASEPASIWVSWEASVFEVPFPLQAVNNNAVQRVKIEITVLFVFMNKFSFE